MAFQVQGQEPDPEAAAKALLDSARRAHNERKFDFAAGRYREFLTVHGSHKDVLWAHYGLGLSLLEMPKRDYTGAINSLRQVSGRPDFEDRAIALYYMGIAYRGIGVQSLALGKAKPNEAQHHHNVAIQNFSQAEQHFAAAAAAFLAQAAQKKEGAERSALLERVARARCDRCDMLFRLNRIPDAGKQVADFFAEKGAEESSYYQLALYQQGYARFAGKDYLGAGKSLSKLAPFQQEFGEHARYMLGRVHHAAGERPEASAHYRAVLSSYEQRKKAATDLSQNQQAMNALDPEQRAETEALVRYAPPDYVTRSEFYLGLIDCEQGDFAVAAESFEALLKRDPKTALVPDVQLRLGFCMMELSKFAEAIKILQPLHNHPQLGDRAQWWWARSQILSADPKNKQVYDQTLRTGIDTMRRAADRAAQLGRSDPVAKVRRGDILLELGDMMQLAGRHSEAANIYQAAFNEKNDPDRAEEALQRQVVALHLAGMYRESDVVCETFQEIYPKSTLLPAVMFRAAENAYLTAVAAAGNPNLPNREQEFKRLLNQAIDRYARVIGDYPEFTHVDLAREGTAAAYYRLEQYDKAAAILSEIPAEKHVDKLATVPYVLADCLLRGAPTQAGDALRAAALLKRVERAAGLLERFVEAQGTNSVAADGLLRLGYCYQQISETTIDPAEQKQATEQAKSAYDRLLARFPQDLPAHTATIERARCLALLGDVNGAINELNRFQTAPLVQSPVAALALIQLSNLLREQRRHNDAVTVAQQCRVRDEAALLQDPARKHWVPELQYAQALALKESGKLSDAAEMFDAIIKDFSDYPSALNAVWRSAQCRREELAADLTKARATVVRPGARPEEIAAAEKAAAEATRGLYGTLQALQSWADRVGRSETGSEPHLRMLYELAWCYRVMAEAEIDVAREAMAQAELEAVKKKLAKRFGPGQALPALRPPHVPLAAVSLRLSERAAHEQYRKLIAGAPSAPLALQARFELAEMYAYRSEHKAAITLLAEALEQKTGCDLAERIRIRLAASLLNTGDPKSAERHINVVMSNPASPEAAHARFLAGEALAQQGEWKKAIDQLIPFRDDGRLQNLPGISDQALLRLGQAYRETKQWNACRQTFSVLAQRFQNSPWTDEALYGVGQSWQEQEQPDRAVEAYLQVTRVSVSEWAAKAQLQAGLCRLAQERYPEALQALLAVPLTYDYPEWNAAARYEAGNVYMAMKQPEQAVTLWKRLTEDTLESGWAQKAQQRLAETAK